MGKFEEALKNSNYCLDLNTIDGNSYHSRGWILYDMGEYENALDYAHATSILEEIIDCNRCYIDLIALRGFLYSMLEDEEENALNDFQITLEANSENIEALVNRGNLYNRLRDFEMAMNDFNTATEICLKHGDPDGYEAFQCLAIILFLINFLFLKTHQCEARRVYLYYKMDDYENALKDLDTLDNFCSEMGNMVSVKKNFNRISHLYRRIIYHKLEKYEKALEYLNEAISILQDCMTMIPLVERALVYFLASRFVDALKDLKKVLIVEPKNVYMSKAMSKGILLYGTMYRHSQTSCMETKLNWLDLRNPDPQMPLSTLKRLKEETSFQDDTIDISDNDYNYEDEFKELIKEFENLLFKAKETDTMSDEDSDSLDITDDINDKTNASNGDISKRINSINNKDSSELDLTSNSYNGAFEKFYQNFVSTSDENSDSLDSIDDSNDETDFTDDKIFKGINSVNDKNIIEIDLKNYNNDNKEPDYIDGDNPLLVEFLDVTGEISENEIMAESEQICKVLNKGKDVDRYDEIKQIKKAVPYQIHLIYWMFTV
ncbi:tetratricopeptide repeat protein [Gigaspora margarita]|uniref:Tetratricopeptide repeat protein n=1 Tax=Gigaspora margarita TaxID=4874 RepID=A0A8H4AMJ9_GIGMA|nr:tetratricopeptide repeat protein [Gigaspora margarita]